MKMTITDIVQVVGASTQVKRCSVVTGEGAFIALPIASGSVEFGVLAELFNVKNLTWQLDGDVDGGACVVATWSQRTYFSDDQPVECHLYITLLAPPTDTRAEPLQLPDDPRGA